MSEEMPMIAKMTFLAMSLVLFLGVLGPIVTGKEFSIEFTKHFTVLDSDYDLGSNQTTIQGIEHTKGWLARDSYEEFVVDGAYSLELGETYFFREKTTHQRGKESRTELVLRVIESW